MIKVIRGVYFFFTGWMVTFFWGSLAIFGKPFKEPSWVLRCERGWGRGVLRATQIHVTVSGESHIDPENHYVYVCNHQSLFDILALGGYLPNLVGFVAKKELTKWPFIGWAIQQSGYVVVDRAAGQNALQAMQLAGDKIRNDNSIVVFPEGTRSPSGELRKFKRGALVLARAARVPIVPVAIVGSSERLPKGSWIAIPGMISIRIGEPIPYEEFADADDHDFTERLRLAVASLAGSGIHKVHEVLRSKDESPAIAQPAPDHAVTMPAPVADQARQQP